MLLVFLVGEVPLVEAPLVVVPLVALEVLVTVLLGTLVLQCLRMLLDLLKVLQEVALFLIWIVLQLWG
jgi:hypothetical protein